MGRKTGGVKKEGLQKVRGGGKGVGKGGDQQ